MDHTHSDVNGLLNASSMYLDGDLSKSIVPNAENLPLSQNRNQNSDAVKVVAKPRSKARQERTLQLAAEQNAWVCRKFNLPESEQVFASFSAALVRSILLQGRIHITTTAVCFYAKLFGRSTKESIPFSRIARVKKRRGGFIANAIKFYFMDDSSAPVVIGSLNHRERAFKMIQDRLRDVNPSAADSVNADDNGSGASAGNSQADSEGRSIDEEDENSSEHRIARSFNSFNNQRLDDSADAPLHRSEGIVNARPQASDSSEVSSQRSTEMEPLQSAPEPATEPSSLVWRTTHDVMDRVHAKDYERKTERARGVLHAPVKEVFNVIFVSDWLRHYHDSSNNRDISFTDWYRGQDGFMARDVMFLRPLGYKIGPKETRVKETQRYSFTAEGGVIIELEGQNLDAPYGDYFVCESFFELIPQDDGSSTLLVASIAVHFKKSTILRGKIESGAMTETKVAFERLFKLASHTIEEHLAAKKAVKKESQKRVPAKALKEPSIREVKPPSVPRVSENRIEQINTRSLTPASQVESKGQREAQVSMEKKMTVLSPPEKRVQESDSLKTMRLIGVVSLIAVCILLVAVLVSLSKMRSELSALETLVAKMSDSEKCVAKTCGTGTGN